MRRYFRATILGLTGGIFILIVTVLLLAFLDRGSSVHHAVDSCFSAINTPLETFLAGTMIEQYLRQAQDPLKTIIVLGLWWGILGVFMAVLAFSIYRAARRPALHT